jgi:sugar lactone lactonase YvrE
MSPLVSLLSRYTRNLAGGKPSRTNRLRAGGPRKPRRQTLAVELLEDRTVPSTLSVANASLNEVGNVSAFVESGSSGLSGPKDLVLGPDGNVYAASSGTNSVIRYTPAGQLLGTFVAAGSGGLSSPYGLAFGPDGNLYVGGTANNAICEYSGITGAFLNTFVSTGSGGLNNPRGMVFGQDGNLYVSSRGTQSVDRYQGPAGAAPGSPLPAAGQSGATFVATASGGLDNPFDLVFGPDGNLYVASTTTKDAVLKFNGTTGGFIMTYVAPGAGGLGEPRGLAFDQDGRLYLADVATNAIHRFDNQGNYLDDPVTSSASALKAPIGLTFDAQGGAACQQSRRQRGRSVRSRRGGQAVSPKLDARERGLRDGRWHRHGARRLHGPNRHRHLRTGPNIAAGPARDPL